MSKAIDHVLLTRFNLPSPGRESLLRAKDGWLRTRLALFERYCLPSVLRQTNQDFEWIIYFDPDSPQWLVQYMSKLGNEGKFTPIYRATVNRQDLLDDLKRVTGARRSTLLTTNLDNDDGLAKDFVDRLQAAGGSETRTAVYLVRGLIRSGNKLYLRTDRINAFCSVRETWESPSTCWSDWHNLLPRSMDVLELEGSPAWLQVVHDSNVSNRVRGKRVTGRPYIQSFGHLLDEVDDLTNLELMRDLAVDIPFRIAKESGRSLLKRATMAAVGKEGLDRLKSTFAPRGIN